MRSAPNRFVSTTLPELVDRVVLERPAADDRGVVDDRVELADGVETRRDRRVVGDVERVHPAAGEIGEELRVACGRDDVVAAGDQLLGGRPADGAGRRR